MYSTWQTIRLVLSLSIQFQALTFPSPQRIYGAEDLPCQQYLDDRHWLVSLFTLTGTVSLRAYHREQNNMTDLAAKSLRQLQIAADFISSPYDHITTPLIRLLGKTISYTDSAGTNNGVLEGFCPMETDCLIIIKLTIQGTEPGAEPLQPIVKIDLLKIVRNSLLYNLSAENIQDGGSKEVT